MVSKQSDLNSAGLSDSGVQPRSGGRHQWHLHFFLGLGGHKLCRDQVGPVAGLLWECWCSVRLLHFCQYLT